MPGGSVLDTRHRVMWQSGGRKGWCSSRVKGREGSVSVLFERQRGSHLGARMLAFRRRHSGGSYCLDPLRLADDMVVSPYRQGLRGVRCAGSSEHGPHLLREGHMGEGGGDGN